MQIILSYNITYLTLVVSYTVKLTGAKCIINRDILKEHFHIVPPYINPLNAELNPICHLLALLGAHLILHVGRIRVKDISNNVKKFEICLKQFLHIHSFYSLQEYFQHKFITS